MVEARPTGGSGGGGCGGGNGGSGGGNNPFGNFFSGGSNDWNIGTILSMKDVSEKTRAHLTRVYSTLLTATGTCALGMWLNATFIIQGFLLMMAFIGLSAFCTYQTRNPVNSENVQIAYMLGLAFSMGFISGPGINHFAEVKPELLLQAVLYTMGAFGSFTAVSLFSQRRSFLFLGGIASSMMSVMFMYSMIGWFMGSAFGLGYIMISLFITCIWIIFDT